MSLRFPPLFVFVLLLLTLFPPASPFYPTAIRAAPQESVLFQKTWGGYDAQDFGNGLALDSSGNMYVTGSTPAAGLFHGNACLLLKYDSTGSLVWRRPLGGEGFSNQEGRGVAVDSSGNIYVTGVYSSLGGSAGFLSKYSSSGGLFWEKKWAGSGWFGPGAAGYGLAVDSAGDIYVTGYNSTISYPPRLGIPLKFSSTDGSLLWEQTWGTRTDEIGRGVAVDSSGNVYVTGFTNSSSVSDQDVFLLKFNSTSSLVWQRTWGGSGQDYGYGVAIDSSGNIFVTGSTTSFGTLGKSNAFLLKYDSSGGLAWQRFWIRTQNDVGYGVVADPSGNSYVTGISNTSTTASEVFLRKYDSAGNGPKLDKTWGGSGADEGRSIDLDTSGNIYIAGSTTTYGIGLSDVILLKSDPSGVLAWQRTWGGSDTDAGLGIALDPSRNIYITGVTHGISAAEPYDVLLLRYNATGSLAWRKSWGGINGTDAGTAVVAESSGNVYIAGGTDSFGSGLDDVFLLKFDSIGNILWQKTWGGTGCEFGNGVALDLSGNVYVTGYTESTCSGGGDIILLKFNPAGDLTWQRTWNSSNGDSGSSVAVDSSGYVYVAGSAYNAVSGSMDAILLKFDSSGTPIWQRTWSRSSTYSSQDVAVDSFGGVYVIGSTNSYGAGGTCFGSPCSDALILKFNSAGNLLWERTWGGSNDDTGSGIAVDYSGNIYATGWTASFGAGGGDAFLLKLNSAGGLVWQKTWGGTGNDGGVDVAVDSGGRPFVTGAVSEDPPYSLGIGNSTLGAPSFTTGTPAGTIGIPTFPLASPVGVVTVPAGSELYAGSDDVFLFGYGLPDVAVIFNVSPSTAGTITCAGQTYNNGQSGLFPPNSPLTCTATPSFGYTYAYWSGMVSGHAQSITFNVGTGGTLAAYFTPSSPLSPSAVLLAATVALASLMIIRRRRNLRML